MPNTNAEWVAYWKNIVTMMHRDGDIRMSADWDSDTAYAGGKHLFKQFLGDMEGEVGVELPTHLGCQSLRLKFFGNASPVTGRAVVGTVNFRYEEGRSEPCRMDIRLTNIDGGLVGRSDFIAIEKMNNASDMAEMSERITELMAAAGITRVNDPPLPARPIRPSTDPVYLENVAGELY